MAIHKKTSQVSGAWAKAAELVSGSKAKIVSEVTTQPSSFTDPKTGAIKPQEVAKGRFQGVEDTLNVSLNRATINALIDAFGEDDSAWQGQALTVETEKVRVAGKAVTALYLIPVGYHKEDDANGYAQIVKDGEKAADVDIPVIQEEAPITENDLPF